jgi:hypothetical protein
MHVSNIAAAARLANQRENALILIEQLSQTTRFDADHVRLASLRLDHAKGQSTTLLDISSLLGLDRDGLAGAVIAFLKSQAEVRLQAIESTLTEMGVTVIPA